MNAIPPKGQMAAKPAPDGDPVRLTMDFGSDLAADALAEPEMAEMGEPLPRARATPRAPAMPAGLAGLELTLTVEVGQLRIPLKDLMAVEPGQLLALDRMTAEPVAVLVNGKLFAHGEIVAVGERFGVRLTDIAAPAGLA
ncbi:flagellar motor switch protein FliN [Sandaracinobacter neustonicus]|uniref:Flagellar motor switch protein FliN n=1 Tax=Sandaracinobacter neustonicus TaxID=1715348 RepID=A0A501XHN1_9SPHN|nr:FliM/FliN family flagellar motor switch protein [Sandaracinobacter neustonicus]TPE60141.1 flagellar motor switch protein FliN [Sandaracinobacter neustonicus]